MIIEVSRCTNLAKQNFFFFLQKMIHRFCFRVRLCANNNVQVFVFLFHLKSLVPFVSRNSES